MKLTVSKKKTTPISKELFGYTGKFYLTAVSGEFPKQNSIKGLMAHYGLDEVHIAQKILEGRSE